VAHRPKSGETPWRRYALYVFIAAVFLLGGGSRHDIQSLIVLRPLAFGFIGYCLIVARREDLARLPLPFYLLLALGLLIALQLAPLPYSVWSHLPGRQIVADSALQAGLGHQARPLTLAPARTWNALFALSVPAAAFLIYAIQRAEDRQSLIRIMVVAAAASALFGFLQTLAGPDSMLYLYRIHNEGRALGFFSNRNHQAIFLAIAMVLSALSIYRLRADDPGALFKFLILASFIVIVIPFLLILGSRAGLVLGIPAALVAPWFIVGSDLVRSWRVRRRSRSPQRRALPSPIALGLGAYYLVGLGIVGAALLNARGEAFNRLLGPEDNILDRSTILPYLLRISRDYLPFGSGFGSFDAIFYQYEKIEHLSIFYLNQAHDDWLQIVIEGGVPAVLLLAVFVVWVLARAVSAIRYRKAQDPREKLGLAGILLMIGVASLVDYPLRVPILMMLAVFVISLLGDKLATPAGQWHRPGARNQPGNELS
jgi:O-antigen ligase